MNQLWQRVLFAVLVTAASAAFLSIHNIRRPLLKGPFGYVLADPDSYQHWGLVRRAVNGEGVRIHWMTTDNAPDGRINEWQSPLTILGVVATRALERVTGWSRDRALEIAGLWLGPVIGVAGLVALAWLGWRAGGLPLAACWLVAWPPGLQVLRVTQFGNTDHHSLHQLLGIVILAGPLAWNRRPTIPGGVVTGLAGALCFWSGASELLPVWLLVAALAVWESGRTAGSPTPAGDAIPDTTPTASRLAATKKFWQAWWISGAVGTTAALVFEFWPQPFHRYLEFLSIWHVALWVIVGALVEYLHRVRPAPRAQILPVAVAILAALLVAGAVRGFDWAHMHVTQDQRFVWQMTVTQEFASYANLSLGEVLSRVWSNYGALPVVLAGLGLVARRLTTRTQWILLAAGGFALLSGYQYRWETFLVVTLTLAVGMALCEWQTRRPWMAVVAMLVATLPCWLFVRVIQTDTARLRSQPASGPHATTFGLDAVARGLQRESPGSVVLAPWDQSGILAGMGGVRVIGTGYWSNLDGLFAGYELLTTTSTTRFRELCERRQIQWLLAREPAAFAGDIAWAFVALRGRVPTREDMESTVVWQIAAHPHAPVAQWPELRQTVPNWKLVPLP